MRNGQIVQDDRQITENVQSNGAVSSNGFMFPDQAEGRKSEQPNRELIKNDVSPLHSAESFDAYCQHVQSRLSEHATRRREFLQAAYERLTNLLCAARDVEDALLYNELWQHRVAVRELLDALLRSPIAASPVAARAIVLPPDASEHRNDPHLNGHVKSDSSSVAMSTPDFAIPAIVPPAKPVPLQSINGANKIEAVVRGNTPLSLVASDAVVAFSLVSDSGEVVAIVETSDSSAWVSAGTAASSPDPTLSAAAISSEPRSTEPYPMDKEASRPFRNPARPLPDIEAEAVRFRASLAEWKETHSLAHPNGGMHVPNALRLRAFACRQRRLEEEAGDTEVAEVSELSKDIYDLLDASDDQEYSVAFDDDLDPIPTVYQWNELADRYEETARAQEAFDWWNENRGWLSVEDIQPLAESVAAIQQRFNRLLFRIGGRDPFQQQLFDDLRTWARDVQCYLHSLRPKVPIGELVERAQSIDIAWETAREPLRLIEEQSQQ